MTASRSRGRSFKLISGIIFLLRSVVLPRSLSAGMLTPEPRATDPLSLGLLLAVDFPGLAAPPGVAFAFGELAAPRISPGCALLLPASGADDLLLFGSAFGFTFGVAKPLLLSFCCWSSASRTLANVSRLDGGYPRDLAFRRFVLLGVYWHVHHDDVVLGLFLRGCPLETSRPAVVAQ